MKKILFILLVLIVPFTLSAQDQEACLCDQTGMRVSSSKKCKGSCYPLTEIKKKGTNYSCSILIVKIENTLYYTGEYDCSSGDKNIDRNVFKKVVEEMTKNYPELDW